VEYTPYENLFQLPLQHDLVTPELTYEEASLQNFTLSPNTVYSAPLSDDHQAPAAPSNTAATPLDTTCTLVLSPKAAEFIPNAHNHEPSPVIGQADLLVDFSPLA